MHRAARSRGPSGCASNSPSLIGRADGMRDRPLVKRGTLGQVATESSRSRKGRRGRGSLMRMLTLARFLSLCAVALCAPRTYATVADDLCPPAADPCVVNTTVTLTSGSVIDLAGRELQFGAAARVTLGAGQVKILAGSVRLLAGAR